MADLVVTPANVSAYDGADVVHGTPAGEAITAGQTIYQQSDGKLYKADASTAPKAAAKGIALNGGAAGQPVSYAKGGGVNPGAVVAIGTAYGVTDTAGGIGPIGDRGAGDFITLLGVATTTSRIDVSINKSGVAIPT